MITQLDGIILQSGQGDAYWVLGDLYTFKATSEETDGKYALLEVVIYSKDGTPLHIHSREAESFYLQEGTVEFQLDDRTLVVTAGTFVHSPIGQRHQFTNIGSVPARMLCWATPAGIEKFFAEIGTKVEDPAAAPPPVTPTDIEKVMTIAPKYGITILPPEGPKA
ncbi:cupin domain-containing protein [Phormidium tenue FACHB-886]|nr:cupin domain-containing protein [Phormidium tenue FACHB-886]